MKRYWRILGFGAVAIVLLVLPLLMKNLYQLHLLNMAVFYAIVSVGLNFSVGLTGITSMAQAAFWGIGAYTSALLAVRLGVSFWIGLPCAGLFSAILAVLLGIPTLRVSGLYLTMVTIGFAEIVRLVLWNWSDVTFGSFGVVGIPKPVLGSYTFSSPQSFYYLALIISVILIVVALRIQRSRIGRAFVAIREDELAADAMGINVPLYKTLAFALSAAYAGISGSLYAHRVAYINPDIYNFAEAIKQLSMVILGGAGSVPGAILGSSVALLLPEWLKFLKEYYLAIYGLGVILIIRYMPGGLISILCDKLWPWLVQVAESLLGKRKPTAGYRTR